MTRSDSYPEIGPALASLLDKHVPDDAKRQVETEAIRVISRARRPQWVGGRSSQLVVGRVQSGKTLSFTAAMALARDSGFPLIIVLAGTKTNLLDQTVERLRRDLLEGDGGPNRFRHWKNPTPADSDDIARAIATWRSDSVPPEFKQTAVLFVLKNARRIWVATDALEEALHIAAFRPFPTLIIDDEADQASLNTRVAKGEESSIYSAINALREKAINHTLLMYTATPQAPLLISMSDVLSPEYVTVLTPGSDYVGGEELFAEGNGNYVRLIPDEELPDSLLGGQVSEIPDSLCDALATFLLCLVIAQERSSPRPLAMLVHPAHKRDVHSIYGEWIKKTLDRWSKELQGSLASKADQSCIRFFRNAYMDLSTTCTAVAGGDDGRFAELLARVGHFLPQVERLIVNSDKASDIPESAWRSFPGWILIGGNKLDRGFTVQNLAVTYMPRGKGLGNADTLQQRGRFFGYKRGYSDLLRGWFSKDVSDSFRAYVRHERSMQRELESFDSAGQPLVNWKRRFILDPEMRMTRRQVVSLPTTSKKLGPGWVFRQHGLYVESDRRQNLALYAPIRKFLEVHGEIHPSEPRRDQRRNLLATMSLGHAMEYLVGWRCIPEEAERLDGIWFLLAQVLDERDEEVEIVSMDGIVAPARRRDVDKRSVGSRTNRKELLINQLFQSYSKTGRRYPGDDHFRSQRAITIQLHRVTPEDREGRMGEETPALAISIPRRLATNVIWQLPE